MYSPLDPAPLAALTYHDLNRYSALRFQGESGNIGSGIGWHGLIRRMETVVEQAAVNGSISPGGCILSAEQAAGNMIPTAPFLRMQQLSLIGEAYTLSPNYGSETPTLNDLAHKLLMQLYVRGINSLALWLVQNQPETPTP